MHGSSWWRRTDWWLIAASAGLVALGVAAIDAATDSPGWSGPAARQLVWAGAGLLAMLLAAWPSYRWAEAIAYVAFSICVVLLVAVYWTEPVNGAQRWLRFGPVGVQPSELAKLAFVAALARYLAKRDGERPFYSLAVPLLLAAVPIGLILKQPDLGTALVFIPVLVAMLLCAGVRAGQLAILLVAGAVSLPALWIAMSPVQRTRITSFLDQHDLGPRPQGEGYQLHQSKLMVALGGVFGSDDAVQVHLPFDHTDFIFSVVAGRWGLAGVTLLLMLLLATLWRGLRIAARAQEPFARLTAVGLVVGLVSQGLINMGMTIGILPITGVTLPFLSYGGSSLLTSFIAVGILTNIGRAEGAVPGPES